MYGTESGALFSVLRPKQSILLTSVEQLSSLRSPHLFSYLLSTLLANQTMIRSVEAEKQRNNCYSHFFPSLLFDANEAECEIYYA